MNQTYYISITGLRLKRPWHMIRFFRLAGPAFRQAKAAKGNISAETKTIDGVHHTLSVWENEDAMREFIYSGVHMKAIKSFSDIATGKTFGYESADIPDWQEVRRLWDEKGREY